MKLFGFVKKVFFVGVTILSDFTNTSSLNANSLSCISMNYQDEWVNGDEPEDDNQVNGDEPVFSI